MFKYLYSSKFFKKLFYRLGYQEIVLDGITRENFFDLYFSLKRPFVVQIGTNDGKTYDPLYNYISKYQLSGLMVEPQAEAFEKLKNNYKDNPNLKFANVALREKDGEALFYRIKPNLVLEGKEYKASSGSSFYKDQILVNVKNRLPPVRYDILHRISNDPNDYIEEISVKVRTLSSLFREYGIEKIDFLLTDCQGYDYAILKQLDFKRFAPDIINFEHSLLTFEELLQSHALLKNERYQYFIHEGDTCAYKIS